MKFCNTLSLLFMGLAFFVIGFNVYTIHIRPIPEPEGYHHKVNFKDRMCYTYMLGRDRDDYSAKKSLLVCFKKRFQ